MVLCQISVPVAQNNTFIPVPLFGIYDVNVINVQYLDSAVTTGVFEVRSDILRFPNSASTFLTFINAPRTFVQFNHGTEEMVSIPNADFNGRLLINVINRATGTTPVNMTEIVITLEVRKK